ncbi:MAG: hypothetical protein QOG59_3468, partial [Solirubrobacteraceae bacterium]|nr:hypothetical protein [Solirubrobacteraceae bacterium]
MTQINGRRGIGSNPRLRRLVQAALIGTLTLFA